MDQMRAQKAHSTSKNEEWGQWGTFGDYNVHDKGK